MAALLIIVLVAAVIVAMERTHRRATTGSRLPDLGDRDSDRVRADLAALEPAEASEETRFTTVGAVGRAHRHWVVLR